MQAATWSQHSVKDLPPIDTGLLGWIVAAVSATYGGWKLLQDTQTQGASRRKLEAEREKFVAERDTQEILGERAMEELRNARMTAVAAWMAEQTTHNADLAARVTTLEERFKLFRSAVLEFITVVIEVLPMLPTVARHRITSALVKLQSHDGWHD